MVVRGGRSLSLPELDAGAPGRRLNESFAEGAYGPFPRSCSLPAPGARCNGADAGVFIGAAFGGVTHPKEASEESVCGENSPSKSALKCGVIGLAVGGVAGAAIGSSMFHTVWVEVDKASLRVSDAPRYRLGLTVSLP